jgi:hypothetical protein
MARVSVQRFYVSACAIQVRQFNWIDYYLTCGPLAD